MTINNRPIPSIQQVQSQRGQHQSTQKNATGNQSFQNVLQQQLQKKEGLKFSKHANARLDSRQIQLNDEQLVRLSDGVDKAKAKGIKESLVLMDNIALVVNVENNTVVTALDQNEAKDHVFTNIDGAVVI